ncbi:AI-2E family transporter [Pontibacter beigongshangensis]|uniref:AI-2E family transporter n=1 Tax=Pontibacter beigongshangensis TaxID=2574733 RepID=UPI001F513910|nr:AI-2E family transporter [Pontibacter beigongshangensis]
MTYGLLFLIMLVYVLVEARAFLYPIIMAMLFAYLLYPVVKILERWGVPRILANLATILVSMALLSVLTVMLYKQLAMFLDDFPALQEKALQNLDKLQHVLDRKFNDTDPGNEYWLRKQVSNALEFSGSVLAGVLLAITGTVTKFGLMPVYTFLMLYYRNKFENFIFRLIPSYAHSKAQRIIDEIAQVTKRYMGGVVTVILILCFINSAGLLIIGVEYAILLGIISALLNFIPYFGTLIGGAIPLLYTLVVQGDLQKVLGVTIFFLLVQFTENNILTPNITGSRVKINPLFTILSIVVGGMIWGLPGMFVSVPMLGMFKIFCDNNDKLSPYAYLLGTEGTEEHAFDLIKLKRFFGIGQKKKE